MSPFFLVPPWTSKTQSGLDFPNVRNCPQSISRISVEQQSPILFDLAEVNWIQLEPFAKKKDDQKRRHMLIGLGLHRRLNV